MLLDNWCRRYFNFINVIVCILVRYRDIISVLVFFKYLDIIFFINEI